MPAKRRPGKILAIDWDAQSIRIVHANVSKRGVKIDRLLSAAVPPEVDAADPEQMGKHIRRVLDQERITTRHAVVDIPRDQAVLKILQLPAIRPEEMPGVVEIQIAKELPFPAAEGVIDFVIGSKAAEGGTGDVLVAVARRELVQQYEATCAQAGLKLDRVGLRPYANRMAVCDFLKVAMPERVVFLDVRTTLMEIDVIRDSALVFSRAASVHVPRQAPGAPRKTSAPELMFVPAAEEGQGGTAGETGVAADPLVQTLLLEVTRSIEAYRANDAAAQMDHAVIAGDTGVEEALAEAIQKRLGITTELYNPAASFGLDVEAGAAASAFSAALGLVLAQVDPPAAHFNFLDPKRVVSQAKERLRKAPIAAAAAILFLAAGVIVFAQTTRPQRMRLAKLNEDIKALRGSEADYKKFLTFVELVEKFDQDQHVWVDVVYDVFSVLPANDELVLTHLDMDQKEGRLLLKTKAIDRDVATKVVKNLREFRREGHDKQRFEATVGPQTERKGEKYPFWQDFRVTILNDEETSAKGKRGAEG